jgi:hypothetical protein
VDSRRRFAALFWWWWPTATCIVERRAEEMRLMDLLCVAFRGRQVQLMGNWTDKSSRPKNERRPPTQTPPISPPFFFQLSSTAGRAKELNPPTHQKRPASRTYIYNHFLGPIQSPLSLLSDRSVCVPPIYSYGSPTQEQLLLRHCNFIFSLFFPLSNRKRGNQTVCTYSRLLPLALRANTK